MPMAPASPQLLRSLTPDPTQSPAPTRPTRPAAAEDGPLSPRSAYAQPHHLGFTFGFEHPLPSQAPKAPPSYAVPPQSKQPNSVPLPAYPAGSGTEQTTKLVGMMDHDVLTVAQQMEAEQYSFVSATFMPPFQTAVLFERNPHTFQVLMGADAALWDVKTMQMAQAGWSYFGRRPQGSFNQVLTYFR